MEKPQSEEEEVLQTKIISPREVALHWELWQEPSKDEVDSLLIEKQAPKPPSNADVQALVSEARKKGNRIEYIPSKLVFAKKPGKGGGKFKVRWVVCGNFESRHPAEENYSSGADPAAFRIMIFVATHFQWSGCALDVKTAFLNAEMVQNEEEQLLLVLPPSFFVERNLLGRDTYYVPMKAVYGFRRPPGLWGEHRDRIMEEMKVKVQEEEG